MGFSLFPRSIEKDELAGGLLRTSVNHAYLMIKSSEDARSM